VSGGDPWDELGRKLGDDPLPPNVVDLEQWCRERLVRCDV